MKILTIIIVTVLAAAIYYFMAPEKAVVSNLTVTPHVGIGPVKFGSSRDEVIKLLGKPDKEDSMNLIYASQGFEIGVKQGQGVAVVSCYDKKFYQRSMVEKIARDFQGATDKGIKLGASQEQIIAVYGNPAKQKANGNQGKLMYPDQGLFFEIENNRLTKMMVFRKK